MAEKRVLFVVFLNTIRASVKYTCPIIKISYNNDIVSRVG